MELKIEAEIITTVAKMVMESNKQQSEMLCKILEKGLDITDKFCEVAVAEMHAASKRAEESHAARMAEAADNAKRRADETAEREEEKKLRAKQREIEWAELAAREEELLKKKPSK